MTRKPTSSYAARSILRVEKTPEQYAYSSSPVIIIGEYGCSSGSHSVGDGGNRND